MTHSLAETVDQLLEVIWRRRKLIAFACALSLLLGSVLVVAMPRTYVAKSLLMLQESSGDLPLSRDPAAAMRVHERIAGLRALLKSDLVLQSVMIELHGDAAPRKPREVAAWIRDFSAAITLELVGTDFLELQLKGPASHGLGRKLEALLSSFIEALLSTNDAMSATQVLLERRKEDLDAAEQSYFAFEAYLTSALPKSHQTDVAALAAATRRLEERFFQLTAARAKLQQRQKAEPRVLGSLISNVPGAAAASMANNGERKGPDTASASDQPAAASMPVEEIDARIAALHSEVDEDTRMIAALQKSLGDHAPLAKQLQLLDDALRRAREAYSAYAKRYNNPAPARTEGLLRAPERIKLIDAPRDPEFATGSIIRIVAASLALGMIVATSLTLLAEMLDPSVRRADEIEALTGAPMLARLPHPLQANRRSPVRARLEVAATIASRQLNKSVGHRANAHPDH